MSNQYRVLVQFTDPVQGVRPVGSIVTMSPDRGAKLQQMGYVTLVDEYVPKLVDLRWRNECLEIYNTQTGAVLLRIPGTGLDSLRIDIIGNVFGNADTATLAATATLAKTVAKDTPANAKESTLTTALEGDNNDLVFTAKTAGKGGDDITIEYEDPAADHTLSVDVNGTDIKVTLGYSGGAIDSKASDVKNIIETTPAAANLVSVDFAAGNSGADLVTAMAQTPLAGGKDGTEAVAGQVVYDGTNLYVAIAANDASGKNWRKIELGALP